MSSADEVFQLIKDHELFLAPLINGDWVAGRATLIYHLEITDDLYADRRLCIDADPMKALRAAAGRFGRV